MIPFSLDARRTRDGTGPSDAADAQIEPNEPTGVSAD
jgi:hypothetical protein